MRKVVAHCLSLLVVLTFLTACEALLGSAATVGGTYLITTLKEDIDTNIAWRAKRAELVANIITGMQVQCRAQEEPDMTSALACYQQLLAFHEGQLPEILAERLARRVKAFKEERREPFLISPVVPVK